MDDESHQRDTYRRYKSGYMTQYAVTIDTEEEWDWDAGWPVRQHSLSNISGVPRFQELCSKHGAKTTWFTDWSVMNDGPSKDIMLDVASRDLVELGMHIHPWLTPPITTGDDYGARESFLATYSDDVICQKLNSVYELFEKEGHHPTSFRGGRYSSGGAIHDFLQSKGFVAEASVVPFTTWPDDGAPDYRHRDLTPNRIAPKDGRKAMWEVPVTLAFTRKNFPGWAKRFEMFEHSPLRHLRPIGILQRLGVVKRVWLNFEDTSAEDMLALLDVLETLNLPCITLTVHSSSLQLGGNPYSRDENSVKRIWETVDQVLKSLSSRANFEPATMTEIAEQLEAAHESYRD